jgi:hypothetical protein
LAKLKAGKAKPGKLRERGLSWLRWLAVGLGIIVIVSLVLILPGDEPAVPARAGELRAAIVDQLHSLQPNPAFIDQVTQTLRGYGFEVDVYRGDDVTVDFYRGLPAHGYKLILFRVHSGLLVGRENVANKVWLFTNEPYSRMSHFTEQLTGKVALAATEQGDPTVFAISADFIAHSMKGSFDGTAIVMMGCSGVRYSDVAQAFIEEGASTYLAWDASVGLNYVDGVTRVLLKKLLVEELAVADAVEETMQERGPDPNFRAVLQYYPLMSANRTLRQLIE